MTVIALVAIIFLAKIADQYSRAVVLATYLVGIPTVAGARALIVRSVVAASRAGRMTTERTVLIGREAQVMAFVADHKPWQLGIALVDVCFLPERAGLAPDQPRPRSPTIWPRPSPIAGRAGRTRSISPCPGRSAKRSRRPSTPS